MDLIQGVIGVILGYLITTSKKILFLIQIILSGIASYIPLSLYYDNIRQFGFYDYTSENIWLFITSEIGRWGILSTLAIYALFFLVIVPYLRKYILVKRKSQIIKYIEELKISEKINFLKTSEPVLRKVMKFYCRINPPTKKTSIEESLVTNNFFADSFSNGLCLILLSIINSIFVFDFNLTYTILIGLLLTALMIIIIIVTPVLFFIKKWIAKIGVEVQNSFIDE